MSQIFISEDMSDLGVWTPEGTPLYSANHLGVASKAMDLDGVNDANVRTAGGLVLGGNSEITIATIVKIPTISIATLQFPLVNMNAGANTQFLLGLTGGGAGIRGKIGFHIISGGGFLNYTWSRASTEMTDYGAWMAVMATGKVGDVDIFTGTVAAGALSEIAYATDSADVGTAFSTFSGTMAPFNLGRGADQAFLTYEDYEQSHVEVWDTVLDAAARTEWFNRVFLGILPGGVQKSLYPNQGLYLPSAVRKSLYPNPGLYPV